MNAEELKADLKQQRAAERQRLEADKFWKRLVADREWRRAADKRLQAACDDAVARRLADEQVTADEFATAKSEGRIVAGDTGEFAKNMARLKLQSQLNHLASEIGYFEIPPSLQPHSLQIRYILKAASDTIKELA